jgi:beta-galactosidase/beta-glucuronidase
VSAGRVHRIHLKGPWEFAWLSSPAFSREAAPAEAECFLDDRRIRMPVAWQAAFGDLAGTVQFRRHFNWPTNLDPGERAFVVFDGIGGTGDVRLNDEPLGTIAGGTASFEVTERFQSRNLLVVTLTFDPRAAGESPGGLWAPVVLEIHECNPPTGLAPVD